MARPRKYADTAEKQRAYRERKKRRNNVTRERYDTKPVKPIMRYFGGKWLLGRWIIDHMPEHRIYVEPFGGAASVLLQKPRSFGEVYNDLDSDVVNLFRVLQDRGTFAELHHRLKYTPFARSEFELAFKSTLDPIEQSRRLLIRSWMGFNGVGAHQTTGYRTNVKLSQPPALSWANLIETIDLVVTRFQGVNIENRTGQEVIKGHDTHSTLFYIDPPYPLSTRGRATRRYRHEMTDQQHRDLADIVRNLDGMVMISGYPCDLYDQELYPDWHRISTDHLADGARPREEALWISPNAMEAIPDPEAAPSQHELFPVNP